MTNAQGAYRVAVVNAGISDPSSTKLLADRIERGVSKLAATRGRDVVSTHIDLRMLLPELPAALGSQSFGPQFERAIAALRDADGIVAAAPVYKAGPSGLFTSFFQTLDNDLLIAKPVVLAATAGTARHALVVDEQMRSMFAYLRAMTVPTSLFASTEDWQDAGLGSRIERASVELLALMEAGVEQTIRGANWGGYQHELGSAGGTELGIELNSDLMRMAAGGGAA
ncbi:CE1759 family FMN reductase [Pseudoclavibacter sp. Z016]|uniref:CE1759 family FMN reductase n=1 Tax=Pseudoclavibacter sp. Z016 TaxID=2080581 RepID=UPI000CE8E293|nr:CE1759 family FMN reductase [Pseudoclavibacter sp. Z016]PPF72277.1 NADH-dependent FMN reductase [Pseudoclavibacter sp. Z016]